MAIGISTLSDTDEFLQRCAAHASLAARTRALRAWTADNPVSNVALSIVADLCNDGSAWVTPSKDCGRRRLPEDPAALSRSGRTIHFWPVSDRGSGHGRRKERQLAARTQISGPQSVIVGPSRLIMGKHPGIFDRRSSPLAGGTGSKPNGRERKTGSKRLNRLYAMVTGKAHRWLRVVIARTFQPSCQTAVEHGEIRINGLDSGDRSQRETDC